MWHTLSDEQRICGELEFSARCGLQTKGAPDGTTRWRQAAGLANSRRLAQVRARAAYRQGLAITCLHYRIIDRCAAHRPRALSSHHQTLAGKTRASLADRLRRESQLLRNLDHGTILMEQLSTMRAASPALRGLCRRVHSARTMLSSCQHMGSSFGASHRISLNVHLTWTSRAHPCSTN